MKFQQQVVAVSALQSMSARSKVKAGGKQWPCYKMEGRKLFSSLPLQIQDSSQWATFFKHCQRILNPDVSSDFLLLPLVLSQRDLWRWEGPAPKEPAVNHSSGLKQSRIWWGLQCGWRVPPSCKCSIQDHLTNNKGEDKQAVPGLLFKRLYVWLPGNKINHPPLIKMSLVKSIRWEEHTEYAEKVTLERSTNN